MQIEFRPGSKSYGQAYLLDTSLEKKQAAGGTLRVEEVMQGVQNLSLSPYPSSHHPFSHQSNLSVEKMDEKVNIAFFDQMELLRRIQLQAEACLKDLKTLSFVTYGLKNAPIWFAIKDKTGGIVHSQLIDRQSSPNARKFTPGKEGYALIFRESPNGRHIRIQEKNREAIVQLLIQVFFQMLREENAAEK